eukprot:TRINITY_DN11390_c0_g1_i2.p1 TRINITY_DN11390_c0_g1~~TRINITY_DN11390_c0_g1_i2.p1  ORF type:complete len:343 (-),score=42.51 TRINITY_DN11390_c0_g1_i2:199-1167(-)
MCIRDRFSTSKAILQTYKKEGRIGKKKTRDRKTKIVNTVIVAQVNPLNPYQSTVIPFISVNETKLPASVMVDSHKSVSTTPNITNNCLSQILNNMTTCQIPETRQITHLNAINQLLNQELMNRRPSQPMMVQTQLLPEMMRHVQWNSPQNQMIQNIVGNRNLLLRSPMPTTNNVQLLGCNNQSLVSYPQITPNEVHLLGRRTRNDLIHGDVGNCKVEYIEDSLEMDIKSLDNITKRRVLGLPNYYPNMYSTMPAGSGLSSIGLEQGEEYCQRAKLEHNQVFIRTLKTNIINLHSSIFARCLFAGLQQSIFSSVIEVLFTFIY